MSTRSILKQLLDSFFFEIAFMYSFSIVVIENLYIQTSLMVALSLFRVKEGGGPIYKSEVDITFLSNENDKALTVGVASHQDIGSQRPLSPQAEICEAPRHNRTIWADCCEGLKNFFWRVGDFPVILCHLIGGWATHSRHVPSGYLT